MDKVGWLSHWVFLVVTWSILATAVENGIADHCGENL
jgi:hypothetical protein